MIFKKIFMNFWSYHNDQNIIKMTLIFEKSKFIQNYNNWLYEDRKLIYLINGKNLFGLTLLSL